MGLWTQPPGGFTDGQRRQRRRRHLQVELAGLALVAVGVSGVLGYRLITAVNPVDRSHAIDLFRAEHQALTAGDASRPRRAAHEREQRRRVAEPEAESPEPRRRQGEDVPSATSSQVAHPETPSESRQPPAKRADEQQPAAPNEGVYSWATEGHEQVGGARRQFPSETQRIISAGEGDTWNQHHYFSEDRQIWTAFERSGRGTEITQQRNKVSFGPVTRESRIEFTPPMLTVPRSLTIGFEWHGEWVGDTYGSYSSKIFERTTMSIGGEAVEVWEMTYVIELGGDQEGRVTAEVWFAPDHGLTVKEHYVQDVESSGATYHAEWRQTLKSLQPRR